MYYKLHPAVALRSWLRVPYAYYIYGTRNAKGLSREEYELLSACDGSSDIEESELLKSLLHRKLAVECEKGDSITDWQRPKFFNNRYFPAANWAITGKCNYNCRHCFMARDNNPMPYEFSFEECVSLLDDMVDCGIQTVTLTGGEPLIRRDFLKILEEIDKRRLCLEDIGTNGSLLTDEILDKMISLGQCPQMKISYDGIGWHDWMRGVEGADEAAIRAIKLCKAKGFPVKVQACFHGGNLDCMFDTAMLMESLGVDEIRIIRTAEAPRWVANNEDRNLDVTVYYDACLDFFDRYVKTDAAMKVDMWSFLTYDPKTGYFRFRPVECASEDEYKDTIPVCRGNRGMVFIGCDGEVAPCNQLSGVMRTFNDAWGNVKKEGLKNLLRDSVYLKQVTATVGELFEHNEQCGDCEYRKLCLGGCRAIGYGVTRNYFGEDFMKCAFFYGGYMDKVKEAMEDTGLFV